MQQRESVDFAILRECSGEGFAGFGFDPRRSPELIARRLKLSPATVRRRLTAWRADGFLLGYNVVPHPALLGGRLAARTMEFDRPVVQAQAIEALSLIDGMIEIDPARNSLLAVYFVDSEAQAARRFRQLQGVPGVQEIGPEMGFDFPPCSRGMSNADWQLVLALRQAPEASLSRLASEVRRSPKAVSRRLDSLLDGGALMFDPIFDFAHFHQTLASLTVEVEPPESRDEIAQKIEAMHPQSIRTWGAYAQGPVPGSAPIHFWVAAPTSAGLDELVSGVAHLPGVTEVAIWYNRATIPVQYWLNERITTLVKLGERSG